MLFWHIKSPVDALVIPQKRPRPPSEAADDQETEMSSSKGISFLSYEPGVSHLNMMFVQNLTQFIFFRTATRERIRSSYLDITRKATGTFRTRRSPENRINRRPLVAIVRREQRNKGEFGLSRQLDLNHDLCLIHDSIISSTSVFSATGHSKPSASSSHSRSPQASAPSASHDSVSSSGHNSDPFGESDAVKRQARGMMGSGLGAGANYPGSFQAGDDYGNDYQSMPNYAGGQGNMGCNMHVNVPTFSVARCSCGSRLAMSGATVVAGLDEGTPGSAMMR